MAHRYRGADVLLVLRLVTRRLSGRADSKDKLAEGSFPFPGCPGPIFLFLPEEEAQTWERQLPNPGLQTQHYGESTSLSLLLQGSRKEDSSM